MLLPIYIIILLVVLAPPPPPCLAQVLPKFPAAEEMCVRATAGCKEYTIEKQISIIELKKIGQIFRSCVCAVKEVNGVLASYAFENGVGKHTIRQFNFNFI